MRYVPRRGSCRWDVDAVAGALASDPLVLQHQRMPALLPTAQPIRGTGGLRPGPHGAPTMAEGITEYGWTTRAWLPYRVSTACREPGVLWSTCSHIGMSFITAVEGHYRFFLDSIYARKSVIDFLSVADRRSIASLP